ncbi:MAG: hypothetical protein AWT59_2691 [Candidatus Gallionella acididurans]|uniref:Uncharacterized protein n=1 Tax=Candidatus Gallionella acididurans TaxID=1796491 RepID=A0A139BQA2_9PROT|nr:MAG: hypothetical protein AWT59_2691 [Candidatus Gallionella acididurans]
MSNGLLSSALAKRTVAMSKRSENDMRNCSGQYVDELYVLDERYALDWTSVTFLGLHRALSRTGVTL